MNKKNILFIITLTLGSLAVHAQSSMNKADSTTLSQIVFQRDVASQATNYALPTSPNGYELQLIGSDNMAVITKSATVFQPLQDCTVNLLFKAIKRADNTSMEIPVVVKVQGKNPGKGGNPKPFVIPALREWYGYEGKIALTAKTRIVLDTKDKATLKQVALILQNDLKTLSRISPAIVSGKPAKGDIFLSLDGNNDELGKEGYYLSTKDYVSVKAAQYKGLFWGTRTILQILEQDAQHLTLPCGISRDYPKYEVRGFLLDVGRKYFTIDFLRDYVKLMSYYKMSDFHIHLSDNAFVQHYKQNWDSTYCGFRLESTTYPNLPTKGEFYTKQQFIDLQILAEQYGVTIIPEIDVPAHSLAFTKAFPQIASKEFGRDHLDLKNPETYPIIENVFKEYLEGKNPVFRGKEVHIGTDEYAKKEAEAFRKFTDHFIKYVQSFGKDVRVWGALTHAQGTTPVTNKNVTMNAWYNGYAEPVEMKRQGYPLISTPDGLLYIVPAAGYYYDYLNLNYLYNNWEPVTIGNVTFNMGDPYIRGGMFAVWNDISKNGITSQDVTDRVFPAIQVLSQKMWTGANSGVQYNDFAMQAKAINETPGLNLRGKIIGTDSLVLNYPLTQKHPKVKVSNASYKTKTLNLSSENSNAVLPVEEIGYNYTVQFSVNPAANNKPDAVLFSSKHACVKLLQGNTQNIGFSREGKNYDFGVSVPANQWTKVTITGDNNSTTLFINGKLAKKLTRVKEATGYKNDSIWVMKTLQFPLRNIGDKQNAFKGQIKNLKVFNKLLTPKQIEALAKED